MTDSLRIAYVCADHGIPVSGGKGASIHIQEIIHAFAGLGHHVDLFAARVGNGPGVAHAELHKIRPIVDYRTKSGGDDSPSRLRKEKTYISVGEAAREALHRVHRENPFDLVYERYSLWSDAGPKFAGEVGIPSVLEVNAPLLWEQKQYRELGLFQDADAIMRSAFARSTQVVAVSKEVAEYALDNGAAAGNTMVVANGVSLDRFTAGVVPSDLVAPEQENVIGFVGGMKQWHGLETLLTAFRELIAGNISAHLLLVGDGPMLDWVKGFLSGAGLEGHSTLTGWVGHDDLPPLLARMDIATAPYPALENFYFSPLKLYEYLAMGLPVVATNTGQISEIITDAGNGFLVKSNDSACFARKLRDLTTDPVLRRNMSAAARNSMIGHSWIDKAAQILARTAIRPSIAAAKNE